MTQEPLFLTVRQAADRLSAAGFSVSKETVQRWCRMGKLAAATSPGGQYRIRAEDVDAILSVPASVA